MKDASDHNVDKFLGSFSNDEKRKVISEIGSLIAMGKTKAFKFIGGPHDGSEPYVVCVDGEPKKRIVYLYLDRILTKNSWYRAAEYRLNIKNRVFEYTGKIINKFFTFK